MTRLWYWIWWLQACMDEYFARLRHADAVCPRERQRQLELAIASHDFALQCEDKWRVK